MCDTFVLASLSVLRKCFGTLYEFDSKRGNIVDKSMCTHGHSTAQQSGWRCTIWTRITLTTCFIIAADCSHLKRSHTILLMCIIDIQAHLIDKNEFAWNSDQWKYIISARKNGIWNIKNHSTHSRSIIKIQCMDFTFRDEQQKTIRKFFSVKKIDYSRWSKYALHTFCLIAGVNWENWHRKFSSESIRSHFNGVSNQ